MAMPEAGTRRASNKSGRGDTRNVQCLNYFSIVVIRFMPKATYRKKEFAWGLTVSEGPESMTFMLGSRTASGQT